VYLGSYYKISCVLVIAIRETDASVAAADGRVDATVRSWLHRLVDELILKTYLVVLHVLDNQTPISI